VAKHTDDTDLTRFSLIKYICVQFGIIIVPLPQILQQNFT